MCGSMEAEFGVQRTIKRAELTAFLCLLRKVSGRIKVHVDNKGIIDGVRIGEKECIKPRAEDAMELEHVKAHRTKKAKKDVAT